MVASPFLSHAARGRHGETRGDVRCVSVCALHAPHTVGIRFTTAAHAPYLYGWGALKYMCCTVGRVIGHRTGCLGLRIAASETFHPRTSRFATRTTKVVSQRQFTHYGYALASPYRPLDVLGVQYTIHDRTPYAYSRSSG